MNHRGCYAMGEMATLPENYIRISMIRPTLEGIPDFPFAPGYRLRSFVEGDRRTWIAIQQLSEPYVEIDGKHFDEAFGNDLAAMPKRGFFLVSPEGTDCGTITAWYNRNYNPPHPALRATLSPQGRGVGLPYGQIHWVAITPQHRGQGLSKAMTAATLRHLRRLGHRRAMLNTQAPRTAAIKAYLDCGFVPDMRTEDARHAWAIVRGVIRHVGLGNC